MELIEELHRLEELVEERWPAVLDHMGPPATDDQVEALRTALDPMVLPIDVEALYRWRNGGGASLFVPWQLLSIEHAIQWRVSRLEMGEPPVLVCLFTDGGGDSLLVETATTLDAVPGTVWQQPHAYDPHQQFPTLAALVATTCEVITAGLAETNSYDGMVVNDVRAAEEIRLSRHPDMYSFIRPNANTLSRFPDPEWPASWLASVGIEPLDYAPRGASHTISALIDAADQERALGTVAGEIRNRGFSAGPDGGWYSIEVTDPTGSLTVQLPRRAVPFMPLNRRQGEVDVEVMSRVEAEQRQAVIDAEEHPELMRRLLGGESRPAFGTRVQANPRARTGDL